MPKTPPFQAFAQRLFLAQKRYELSKGKELDRAELGAYVGKAVKWGKPFSLGTVSQWFLGNQMPSVGQLEAIARYLDASPAYLAFGNQDEFVSLGNGEPKESASPSSADHRQRRGRRGH